MPDSLDARHPLLVLVNAWGDQLLNLPAIRAAATLFEGRLSLAVRRGAPNVCFQGVPVRRFLELDLDFSSLSRRFDADNLAGRMGSCDLLLSLSSWHDAPTRRLMELLQPKWSVGYHREFDEPLELDYGKHNADLGFDLVHRLNPSLRVEDFAAPPVLDPEAVAFVDNLLRGLPEGYRLIVLHGETKADKVWPCERFVRVLDHVLGSFPETWVIDVGHDRAPHDTGSLGGRVIPAPGLPMRYALAVVARAHFFLGVDSVFLHAADLFRVPGVALFGPTDPHEFGFRFTKGRHVKRASMQEIEVEAVTDAAVGLLKELDAQ
jgi:ADP-heptose:LPS heptosyltransferase